ncbi:MAG: glycoside hydrolase family 65 protein, partial [Acidimicrobiia bacterium]|nr:glycoside hydrolase family 65 protein [Acidimicrobiia bacterium]
KIDLIPEPGWHDPPKAQIDRLVDAVVARLHSVGLGGLPEIVTIARAAASTAGLSDPRVTSDAKHVEIGLTDKSDSSHWIFEFLSRAGVGPGHVLLAGDEFGALGGVRGSDSMMMIEDARRSTVVSVGREPSGVPANVVHLGGGPEQFTALLRDQLGRRIRGDVPDVDEDPEWTIVVDGYDREHERAAQAVLTIADGHIGTRGCALVHDGSATPAVVAAGVYHGTGPETTLAACPLWHQITTTEPASSKALRRVLDLRTFMLHESHRENSTTYRALRLSSLARPGTVALRADGPTGDARVCPPLMIPEGSRAATGTDGDRVWMSIESSEGGVTAAATQRERPQPGRAAAVERLGVFVTDAQHVPSPNTALERLDEVEKIGFDQLVDEHRRAWARRWHDAKITIDGDPRMQRAARFAVAHLLASAADHGEAAVGARGLTGAAYRGHVFWDADVFVLPALAATNPRAARAMLEYRARRLPVARNAAHAEGRDGARFPWESARTGRDVTPRQAVDRRGRVIAIRTGALEVHIVGCIAWACATYLDWTGDAEFAAGTGADLIVETARYWASRVHVTDDGRAHIFGVIGPDEYHEGVDDNAFTNVLARWNLRRAAAFETPAVTNEERDRWLTLADSLVDGYNPDTGRYEQFAGFADLDPVIIAEVAPRRPIAADLLLGPELVRRSQIIKQADVLMLHHMLPDEVAVGSLEPNLAYYEPRTAHGSSLSPGIYASLFARAGRSTEALDLLDIAGHIDLDDITDTTSGGLHLATMGSMWQALAFGVMGLRARDQALEIDPRIPEDWSAFEMQSRFHDRRITVRAEPLAFAVSADSPVTVRVGGHLEIVGEGGLSFERRGG